MNTLDYQSTAGLFKVLSDENRLKILHLLRDGELSVSAIAEALQVSQPLVSHHLKEMRHGGLITIRKKGVFVYHRLTDENILEVIHSFAILDIS